MSFIEGAPKKRDSRTCGGPCGYSNDSRPPPPAGGRGQGNCYVPSPQWPPDRGYITPSLPTRPVPHANLPTTRYGDGEVTRYGAGESYRPYNRDRSPRRSPRRRSRTPPRDARRSPPPAASDCYVPSRTPRRRSRSTDRIVGGDRYRTPVVGSGGERWRGRERSRSRDRRPSPRRYSPRRSPRRSPGRYSPLPRRDDRDRDRPRSPPVRIRDSRFAGGRPPSRISDLSLNRRRSRSPVDRGRDRERDRDSRHRVSRDVRDAKETVPLNAYRARSSPRRVPTPPRGSNTYRPRSRTPERRDDRCNPAPSTCRRPSPPPRESAISSAMTSRSASRRNSPRPPSVRVKEETPVRSPPPPTPSKSIPVREAPKPSPSEKTSPTAPTPPRGPAALRRAVPTGPSATRNVSGSAASPMQQSRPLTTTVPPSGRSEISSPVPPTGPRGYVSRSGFGTPRGGGRGAWNPGPPRHMPPPVTTQTAPSNPASGIPTGPRAATLSTSSGGSPSLQPKPFNPPTGPSAHNQSAAPARPKLAQGLINAQPQLIPGGKIDPALMPLTTGVTKELEPHFLKLKAEEEKIRDELMAKRERLRKNLHQWDKVEREAKVAMLRSELTDESLAKVAGEVDGVGF